MRSCAQKLEADALALERMHALEGEASQEKCEAEQREFEEVFEARKRRLVSRWELAVEVWKKRRVDEGVLLGLVAFGIAAVEWPGGEMGGGVGGIAVAY